tara:strand:- start:1776 stop:3008 length:1233 start_codon:yes stop_codon:yes gene_type:complete
MQADYQISIYLDTRRAKSNGLYPVKLRVYETSTKKRKLYPTKFEFSESDFASIWNTTKPKGEFKARRLELQSLETHANSVAESIETFSFEALERRLFRNKGDGVKLNYHYDKINEALTKSGRLGSASSYDLSRKSLIGFYPKFKDLTFSDVTVKFLNDYESYMINKGSSTTTVGVYLRALRAIFNTAITEDEIKSSVYPFGKGKYQIPASKGVKKALNNEQLKAMFKAKPKTPEQQKAKDFWFFSFMCNGMNFKDIAQLKHSDIKESELQFVRAKTALTSKANQKTIVIHLNDFALSIIKKYGSKDLNSRSYVFNVLNSGLNDQEQRSRVQSFVRTTNQHMKKLCLANDLQVVSTYWARHSFATKIVRDGASLELASESLGHSNLAVTQGYFAGFGDEVRREMSEGLMKF